MEDNQIIVDVGLDAFIESLRHLQKQYELNTAALKAMKDAGEEQSDAYIMLTQEQKVLRQQIASTEKAMQNEIKMQQAQEGSLVQLRAQLANLQKQYDSMSGMERMGEAGTALQKRIKALHDEVLGLEGDTGRMQRNVGNYPAAIQPLQEELSRLTKQLEDLRAENKEGSDEFAAIEKRVEEVNQSIAQLNSSVDGVVQEMAPLKQQIKDATNELMQMKLRGEENTEQYQQMLEHLGKLKDTMMDAQAEIKQMASDTGALNSVLDGAKAAAGGFSVALGVMTLVGDKDSETAKELAEAQAKLQSAIAITTGLQAVQNALQKESAFMMGVNKIKMLAAAAAQKVYAAATRDAEAAQAVFNKVAKSNVYVWLAGVILTVVGAIAAFTRGSKEQEEQVEQVNRSLNNQAEILQRLTQGYADINRRVEDSIEGAIEEAKARGASAAEIRELEDALFETRKRRMDQEKKDYEEINARIGTYETKYSDTMSKIRALDAQYMDALKQGNSERAQFYQDEINKLAEVADAIKKRLDAVNDFNSRYGQLLRERQAQLDQRKKEEEEEARRQREAAKAAFEKWKAEVTAVREANKELIDNLATVTTLTQSEEEHAKALDATADSMQKLSDKLNEANKKMQQTNEYMKALGEMDIMEKLERQSRPLYNFSQEYEENAQAIMETSAALQSSFSSVASMYQQMAKDETKSEEERAKAARKAKAWSKIQIATNAGAAVAKGVATAVDVGFPAAIPAIATMTATILAAIAQAKALLAEAHEHGGVIGNKFIGATRGGDNVLMTGRRGELVLNADQQKRLYDIANGSASSNLTASLVEALQAMPAPILDYSEFVRFKGRVVDLDNFVTLK